MKKTFLFLFSIAVNFAVAACEVCEKRQPKVLRGISHGVPEGEWDYVIVSAVAVITVITLFFAVKWIVKPGEKEKNHIKYSSLIFE